MPSKTASWSPLPGMDCTFFNDERTAGEEEIDYIITSGGHFRHLNFPETRKTQFG